MHDVFKSFSDSGWRYIIPPQWKNRQVVSQMYQVRPVTGENRKHWAVTLYYQRNISWPALDGLMIDHCSFIFQSGQVPTNTTKKKRVSFRWMTVTLGTQVVPDGSKVNWFGEGRLQGSDWEAEGPVSVLCKVQSCVTYWHTRVCLEYHWVLCRGLEKNKPAVCEEEKKKTLSMSSPLFSTWVGWIQSWWKYKWDAASTEVSCFLYLLSLCDCSLFFFFLSSHRNQHDSLHLCSGYRWPCFAPC